MKRKNKFLAIAVILSLLVLAVVFAIYVIGSNKSTGYFTHANVKPSVINEENVDFSVYFCMDENISCKQKFIDVINNANDFVYCALYSLNQKELIDTINQKNVTIKIVMDADSYIRLEKTTKKSTNTALMHDKFCVTDKEIITGSYNPTVESELYNDNNIVITNSSSIRENYIEEFYELFDQLKRETPNPDVLLNKGDNEILIENYFCPEDSCEEQVISELLSANHSIQFLTFSFTSDSIGDVLVNKYKDGILVQGVFEKQQESKYSERNKLFDAGCEVKFDNNKHIMHHKVFIIDNETVITGSYNPTANANTRNDENILIIHNKEIANEYQKEFVRVWNDVPIK